jgi:hypothetical protein
MTAMPTLWVNGQSWVVLDLSDLAQPVHVDTAPAYDVTAGQLAAVRFVAWDGTCVRLDGRPEDVVRILRHAANDLEQVQRAVDQAAARRLRQVWRASLQRAAARGPGGRRAR